MDFLRGDWFPRVIVPVIIGRTSIFWEFSKRRNHHKYGLEVPNRHLQPDLDLWENRDYSISILSGQT
jgi:hypothetical protein